MGEVLIKVEGISKKFAKDLKKSLLYGLSDVFIGITRKKQNKALRKDEFWAVKDINFEVKRGECLGLIGHNGAGKSTLLKILNGLIAPDEGNVTIYGKVGALIELGAGFNPILTGRENVYNNAALIGFSRYEIDAKFNDIVVFSELEEFIDMPVQNYSSGMKVRLGFAVAAQMEPDVLIIDEVLAVGDASFRAKCFNKMSELSKKCAMIFVSHSIPLVGRICSTALLLEKGIMLNHGYVNDIIFEYLKMQDSGIQSIVGEYKLPYFKLILQNSEINYLDDLYLNLIVEMPVQIEKFFIHYSIIDSEQKTVYQSFSIMDEDIYCNDHKRMEFSINIKTIDLTNGKYYINIGFIENGITGKNISRYDAVEEFVVKGSKFNSFASILKSTQWKKVN